MSTTLPLPDDPIVFELELSNLGVMPSAFQLYTEHRSNPGMLNHVANGDTLTAPQQYDRIDANETISTLVTITRGPLDFDYGPFKVFFRSACENVLNIGDGNLLALSDVIATAEVELFNVVDPSFPDGQRRRIRFAEPCPGIEWDGDLAAEQAFRVNLAEGEGFSLKIEVRNPQAPRNSFADLVNQVGGRLQEAGLWFRPQGSTDWQRAVDEEGQPIDFSSLPENRYGIIAADWFVGNLPDGDYEIEARTMCEPSNLIPVAFHSSATPRLDGVLDRERPELFVRPTPGPLAPADFFRFEFTEPIRCTKPHVFEGE